MSATLIGSRKEKAASPELLQEISPAERNLAAKLSEYEKACLALTESEAHLERSKADEQAALNDSELSDQEAADRVAVAQRSRGIYAARVSSRQAAQTKLLAELTSAVQAAQSELSSAVYQELARRRATLIDRIMQAGQLGGDVTPAAFDELLASSKPMIEIERLQIPAQSLLVDGASIKESLARRLLDNYDKLKTERERTI